MGDVINYAWPKVEEEKSVSSIKADPEVVTLSSASNEAKKAQAQATVELMQAATAEGAAKSSLKNAADNLKVATAMAKLDPSKAEEVVKAQEEVEQAQVALESAAKVTVGAKAEAAAKAQAAKDAQAAENAKLELIRIENAVADATKTIEAFLLKAASDLKGAEGVTDLTMTIRGALDKFKAANT
jgi:hypothetical protein